MGNEIKKPLILEIDEAKTEIIQCINNVMQVHKLPCYIVDMILSDVGTQIKDGVKSELAMAREQVREQQE
jgi:hypothetical protein